MLLVFSSQLELPVSPQYIINISLCGVLAQGLRAGVNWGQEQFQLLLQEVQGSEVASGSAEDVGLEELRYRWMLYKSKLKDVGDIRVRASAKVSGLTFCYCKLKELSCFRLLVYPCNHPKWD